MNTDNASHQTQDVVKEVTEETFDAAVLGTTKGAEQPVWFEIASNVDGSPSGIQFYILGRDSEAWRKLNRHNLNKRFDKMAKTRKLKLTAEEQEAEGLELLCATIQNFRSRAMARMNGKLVPVSPEKYLPVINIHGEKYSFSKESLKRIFDTVPEIREQIEDFQTDRVNFLPGSPAT